MAIRPIWCLLPLFLALAAAVAPGTPGCAAVDVVTLPTQEDTQLTIYNSADITMVREHRLLTVKQGVNRIQFSWANTLIDPTSIEFRILDKQDQVDLVDTTFPAGRNDVLQWNVTSRMAGKVPVEIRYFTSGITWAADYVGIANEDETRLRLTGYVRVTNDSGEQYDNAQTRLVVGNINLVEKIADLAQKPAPEGGEHRKLLDELNKLQMQVKRQTVRSSKDKESGKSAEDVDGGFVSRWIFLESGKGRKGQGCRQGGLIRILPLHHRRPRGHQRQGAQAADGPERGRRAAGVCLQTG